jgi:hypothetical protein
LCRTLGHVVVDVVVAVAVNDHVNDHDGSAS